ncbi:MAG: pyruvate dehydrogenase complex dihydrolipoamide acetyltransferase [Proteobacteria bacterium]|nr:MAG: pyruvate dehydrogenase complex dihydrolipoamide acetyltransferase [Pseudomonadota bacterium]
MAEVIRMPKMSDTMTEGVIASWQKQVGDTVKSGDVLAEVETDKATMDLESYHDGVLLHIGPKKGETVAIDGILAIIGKEGEDISGLLDGDGAKAEEPKKEAASAEKPAEETQKEAPAAEAKPAKAAKKDTSNIKATVVRMPKMSDTMTEGVIASWQKEVGDKVKSGDVLAEIETDKATMDFESYDEGTLLYIGPKKGESVAINAVLAIIGQEGADYQALLDAETSGGSTETEDAGDTLQEADSRTDEAKTDSKIDANTAATGQAENALKGTAPASVSQKSEDTEKTSGDGGRVFISPLARKLAEVKGIELSEVKGSGENGRIVKRDIENFTPAAKAEKAAATTEQKFTPAAPIALGEEKFEEVPVSQMRKIIAKRLAESKFAAPHFYLTMEIDMDKAIASRESLNAISPVKISFNDIVLKACAAALKQHPAVNSSWLGDKIRFNQHVHIGVAVAVDEGLLVPVVRFADQKSLSQIAAEVKDLGGRAKAKKLQPKDWEGNTFTISNLGMFGIEEFTAIINPPDACILAVGAIKQTPVVRDGEIKIGNVMKVTMSCDHRVVDGASGAAFLNTLKGLLEDPVRMLV